MFREWVLIAWIGTSTNFVMLEGHPNHPSCMANLDEMKKRTDNQEVTFECRQEFREGRSELPRRPGSQGVATR